MLKLCESLLILLCNLINVFKKNTIKINLKHLFNHTSMYSAIQGNVIIIDIVLFDRNI